MSIQQSVFSIQFTTVGAETCHGESELAESVLKAGDLGSGNLNLKN